MIKNILILFSGLLCEWAIASYTNEPVKVRTEDLNMEDIFPVEMTTPISKEVWDAIPFDTPNFSKSSSHKKKVDGSIIDKRWYLTIRMETGRISFKNPQRKR